MFIDTGTSNTSFLQVASDLKEAGIKFPYFMLEIKDPELVNIDPYADPTTLSSNDIYRINTECLRNPWYYLREISRISDPGAPPVRYRANRGNIAQAWCTFNGIDSFLNLPRQQGKTQSAIALFSWAYSYGTKDTQFIFVNMNEKKVKENLQRLKDQQDHLPIYMKFESVLDDETGKTIRKISNATKMKHPVTNNSIVVYGAGTTYDAALSIARGLTSPFMFFDEVEFCNCIKVILENSAPTYGTAAERSELNGAIHARVLCSTPGDLDSPIGQAAESIHLDSCKWTERLYDMTKEQARTFVKSHSTNDIVYIEYSYIEIGRDEAWFNDMARKINNPLTVRREILLQRLRGSDKSPYNREDIEYIIDHIKPFKSTIIINNATFYVYDDIDKSIPYIIGVDVGTGTNADNNAVTIINPYTEKPVMEFSSPYIGETEYEEILTRLIQEYLPMGILVIERNSVGDSIIDHLLHSPVAHRLYYDKAKDLHDEKLNQLTNTESILKAKASRKSFYGVYTATNRNDMFAILGNRVVKYKDSFVTKNISEDIARLEMKSGGRIEARSGFHDDSIMSYLIGMYVLFNGNNLLAFGLNRFDHDIDTSNSGMTIDECDPELLPKEIVETLKARQQEAEPNFEEILREAMMNSEKETAKLAKAGLISAPASDYISDTEYSNNNSIPMSFFDEMNS